MSLPIRPEQYDAFHPVMAEIQNVRVEEMAIRRLGVPPARGQEPADGATEDLP